MNHFNHDYYTDGDGNVVPIGVGDRYYAQDLARDFHFLRDEANETLRGFVSNGLVSGGVISQGTTVTDLDVTPGQAIVLFDVDIPDDISSRPGTKQTVSVAVRVSWGAITDHDFSGTATLDGVTVNYVKASYAEADGTPRARALASGSYAYERQPSYSIEVSPSAPTDYQANLGTIVSDGVASTFTTSGADFSIGGDLSIGGGLSVTGNASVGGDVSVTGEVSATTLEIGGGYGLTGVSISADGNVSVNGTVTVDGAVSAATLNTGHGANELYAMNQAVRTTDNVAHAIITASTEFRGAHRQYNFSGTTNPYTTLSSLIPNVGDELLASGGARVQLGRDNDEGVFVARRCYRYSSTEIRFDGIGWNQEAFGNVYDDFIGFDSSGPMSAKQIDWELSVIG